MIIRLNYNAKLNQFKVVKLINEHIDSSGLVCHKTNASNFELLPKNRKLNTKEREEVIQMKKIGADSKKLLNSMRKKTGKSVQLKDIHNIVHSQKSTTQPDFIENLEMGRSHIKY